MYAIQDYYSKEKKKKEKMTAVNFLTHSTMIFITFKVIAVSRTNIGYLGVYYQCCQ